MSYYPEDKETQKDAVDVTDREVNDSDSDSNVSFTQLKEIDHAHDISLRTMSWQKAAFLLCGDQVCLAVMAQSWSLSVLGWVPGIITMVRQNVLSQFE